MSTTRLIVKNLPSSITADKLHEIFGAKGVITDVQLKYTKDGKFRKFGFIGYKNEENAKHALEFFNNTFINASQIKVEECKAIGDPSKPRAWSKYSRDSSAYKKGQEPSDDSEKSEKLVPQMKIEEKKNEGIIEAVKKYNRDPLFAEFIDAHTNGSKTLRVNEKTEESNTEDDSELREAVEYSKSADEAECYHEEPLTAKTDISDKEYLKTKMKSLSKRQEEAKNYLTPEEKAKVPVENTNSVQLFKVKLKGLKYNTKKKAVKQFFQPLEPYSVNLPAKMKGIAYVGFKTEHEMKRALKKHKSFLAGRQIFVTLPKKVEPNEETERKWEDQKDGLKDEEDVAESGRLFVRNLPYTISEDDVEAIFKNYGTITELIMPIDKYSRSSKGYALITYLLPENAMKAYTELDGSVFHGRMLHILPGKEKKSLEELLEKEGLTYKEKRYLKKKIEAASSHNWNTLFLGQNAIADIIAKNYNTTKEKVLDSKTSESLAVRLALGETQIVSETRQFLIENGVHLDAFNQPPKERSKTILLAKNLPAETQEKEIRQLFAKFGELRHVLLPPSGVTAIVEFLEPYEAKTAFRKLAYSRFKNVPLYLEWAPSNTFCTERKSGKKETADSQEINGENREKDTPSNDNMGDDIKEEKKPELQGEDSTDQDEDEEPEPDTTLFIKNLNFQTTEDAIKELFKKCGRIHCVTVTRKKNSKSSGQQLSMGYGFIQFKTKDAANKALKSCQNALLDGHSLELKRSNKTLQTGIVSARKLTQVRKQTGGKILVKNVPFQATKQELWKLFSAFGTIKHLRLPQKMAGTGSHRGFAFVEYFTKHDAKRAFKDLSQSTHLYGRRLVLEWAATEENLDEMRRKTAEMFTKRTSHHIHQKGMTDLNMEGDE